MEQQKAFHRMLLRFTPRNRLMANILLSYWVILNFAPYIQVSSWCFRQFGFCTYRMYQTESFLALAVVPFIFVFETAAILLIVGVVKGICLNLRSGSSIAFLVLIIFALLVLLTLYFIFLFVSWGLYSERGAFPSLEDFSLLRFLTGWHTDFTVGDIQRIALVVVTSFLLASFSFLIIPPFLWVKQIYRTSFLGIIPLMIGFIGIKGVLSYQSREHALEVQNVAAHFISPGLSLFWSSFFFGKEPSYELHPLKLEPRIDEKVYFSQISAEVKRKNILILVVEALRADVVSNTDEAVTVVPNINRLAKDGYQFPHAYSQCPETGCSLFTIVTGLYPLLSEARCLTCVPDFPFVRIFDVLSKAGYRTAYLTWEWLADKAVINSPLLDLAVDPQAIGPEGLKKNLPESFIKANPVENNFVPAGDKYNVETLKLWLRENKKDTRPLLAMIYFMSPHFAHVYPPSAKRPFLPDELPYNPTFGAYPKTLSEVMKNRYKNSLHYIDSLIGDLINFFQEEQLLEDTVVIITGDHGELFHEHDQVTHSGFLFEEAIRVPLIVSGAKDYFPINDGKLPVGHVDIAPTILSLVNIPNFPGFQGKSILTKNPSAVIDQRPTPIFSVIQVLTHEDALILWPWKFVRNFRGFGERMFNLEMDPKENNNLINAETEKAKELKAFLKDFRDKQLTYYSLNNTYWENFFPPKY